MGLLHPRSSQSLSLLSRRLSDSLPLTSADEDLQMVPSAYYGKWDLHPRYDSIQVMAGLLNFHVCFVYRAIPLFPYLAGYSLGVWQTPIGVHIGFAVSIWIGALYIVALTNAFVFRHSVLVPPEHVLSLEGPTRLLRFLLLSNVVALPPGMVYALTYMDKALIRHEVVEVSFHGQPLQEDPFAAYFISDPHVMFYDLSANPAMTAFFVVSFRGLKSIRSLLSLRRDSLRSSSIASFMAFGSYVQHGL